MNFSVPFLDCLIVLIIVVSAGYAAWRGFLWETLTVFAWVAAAFGCLWLGPSVFLITKDMVQQEWLARLIAYAAVFCAIFIPFAFMSHRFSESVKHSPIGPLDRAAGVAFGVVRGLVIIGAAYLVFTYYVAICAQPKWLTEAHLLPVVQTTAETLVDILPHHDSAGIVVNHCGTGPVEASRPSEIEQEPGAAAHDPMADLIRHGGKAGPSQPAKPDSMADLIRNNGKSAAPAAKKDSMADLINSTGNAGSKPATKTVTPASKSAGASDRQRLNDLVETGGNTNR
jgi:membrane protein required for colicin V production